MKLGKKFLATGCALALTLSMGVTAFAAGGYLPESPAGQPTLDSEEGTYDITLTADNPAGTPADVYSVEISYDDLDFTYTKDPAKWDPSTHTLTEAGEGKWDAAKTVTVKNHSNKEVYAKAELLDATGQNGAITQNYTEGGNEITITLADEGLDGTTAIAAENVEATNSNGHTHDGTNDKTASITVTGNPAQAIDNQVGAKLKVTVSSTEIAEP